MYDFVIVWTLHKSLPLGDGEYNDGEIVEQDFRSVGICNDFIQCVANIFVAKFILVKCQPRKKIFRKLTLQKSTVSCYQEFIPKSLLAFIFLGMILDSLFAVDGLGTNRQIMHSSNFRGGSPGCSIKSRSHSFLELMGIVLLLI